MSLQLGLQHWVKPSKLPVTLFWERLEEVPQVVLQFALVVEPPVRCLRVLKAVFWELPEGQGTLKQSKSVSAQRGRDHKIKQKV